MLHSYKHPIALLLVSSFLCSISLFSQTITFELPDEFFVCSSAPFEVTVTNNTGAVLDGATLRVDFTSINGTDCGIGYLPNTVLNATESNISDLGAPVFALNDLAIGEAVTVTFDAEAPCATIDCIDGSEVFVNEISLNWNGGNTATTTSPYDVTRALLVISEIKYGFMQGSLDDQLIREITIVNTRLGAIQSFTFTDVYQGGITIISGQGTTVPAGSNTLQLEFDGSDFTSIGDGDEWFELNESITIREIIRVADCGVDITSAVSQITAEWGCGGEFCQEVSKLAVVDITPSKKIPDLRWEPITSVGECFCGPDAYRQGMLIKNVGSGAAVNLVFDMRRPLNLPFDTPSYRIDTASIIVDSAGTLLDISNIGFSILDVLEPPCNGTDNGLANSFILTIPRLGPQQELTVFWDIYFCSQNKEQPKLDWEYRWNYFKECPPNPYIEQENYITVHDENALMETVLFSTLSGMSLMDEDTVTMNYRLEYDSLALLGNEFVLQIGMPCGLNWIDENELLLGGQAPISIEQVATAFSTSITATYQLPFLSDSVGTSFDLVFNCEDVCYELCDIVYNTSCPLYPFPCGTNEGQSVIVEVISTINKCPDYPLGCNMQTCDQVNFSDGCPRDSQCVNSPPGYVEFDFEAVRDNFGLPDNDNDRKPDATGVLDMTKVARHNLIAGDTIRAKMAGEVVIDSAGVTLPFGQINLTFRADQFTSFTNRLNFLNPDSGLVELDARIRIFDSSAGVSFECNNPTATIDTIGILRYEFDISADGLQGCLPAGFEYDQGDSIIFEGLYLLAYNMLREPPPTPLSATLELTPEIYVFNENVGSYEPISCQCTPQPFIVSGYEYSLLPGLFGLPPCDSSNLESSSSILELELAENNFFPFEHRNLIFIENYRLVFPPEITLCEVNLRQLNHNNNQGPTIAQNEPLDFVLLNGEHIIDLSEVQNPPIDEGFVLSMQYIFKTECDVDAPSNFDVIATLDFLDSMPEDPDPLDLIARTAALQPLIPNLSLDIMPDITSFNDQLKLDFWLVNDPTTLPEDTSGAALNTWLFFNSLTGLVTDLQLVDPITGDTFPSENGVFQLGDFDIGRDSLRICGVNNSCEQESIEIHYGWNCDPFTDQLGAACYHKTEIITLVSPPGEIDFLVTSPAGCFDLCENTDPYSLQIFNGDLGAVYELIAQAQLPLGQSIVPSSSQVEYPTGSGIFFPINDPTLINSTLAQWDLSAFDSLADGLPGIGSANANSITLFFETTTECGFIADAFPLFTIAAEQNCDIPTNTITKAGDPVCINGISQPYSTNIQVETQGSFSCADEMVFEVAITASQTLPLGACVIVTLPQGVSLVPNSCSSDCQANFNCNPTVEGNNFTWQLPEGVVAGDSVCFTFNTSGWSTFGCEQGLVVFRTANETQALCAATGEDCSTKANTGSLLFPYDIQRPEFELDNFVISASQTSGDDIVDFSLDIINCGAQNEPPILVDFFLDTDGDGSGDQLVHSESFVAIISDCQSETMMGSFSLPPGNLCNLIAYVNPDQCACSIDSLQNFVPVVYQTDQSDTICSYDAKAIGVMAMPGFVYEWEPADCLQNGDSSMTVFSCENNSPLPVTYQFTLNEKNNDGCEINNQIDITVQPMPGITFAETLICAGDTANLYATDGVSYNWLGPGITDPTQQAQTVIPLITSVFSVAVVDAFGCAGSDSVLVEVNPLPDLDAGDDITVCPGNPVQLNATCNPDWQYLWSPATVNGLPSLSSPTICDPTVLTDEDVTFILEVIDENGCMSTDEVAVNQSGALDLVITPDTTICLGDFVTLTVSGGETYLWSEQGDCNDPSVCDSLTVMPSDTTTYTVVASTVAGCLDSATVTVSPSLDDILTYDTIVICEGEFALIHGNNENVEGVYVNPTFFGDCMVIDSVWLFVNPVPEIVELDTFICDGDTLEFLGNTYTTTTSFMDTLVAANNCDSIILVNLTVGMSQVEIIGPDTVSIGEVFTLEITPTTYDSIIWTGGNMGPECNNSIPCQDSILDNEETYYVTTWDENDCIATDTHIVYAIIRCFPDQAAVPNVFTPNGDGTNDTFSIVSRSAEVVLDMRIWDRWGNKVYDGIGPWDGTYNGKPAGSDVYIYDIVVGCPAGVDTEEFQLRGDVTLLR